MISEEILKSMIKEFKGTEATEKEIEQVIISGIFSGAAILAMKSDMHEEEGVYECSFTFKLNTEDFEFDPLDGLKLRKLRGKTND